MKYWNIKLVILLLLFQVASCSIIHYMTVDKQKPESKNQYQLYLNSLNQDTIHSYQLKKNYYDSISTCQFAINTYKLKTNTNASPVQIRVYSNNGNLINGYEQCFGELSKTRLLDSFPLKTIKHFPINYNLRFSKDIQLFINDSLKQNQLSKLNLINKYTFVIFYAKWLGYYSTNTIKLISKHIQNKKDILIIFVNTSP